MLHNSQRDNQSLTAIIKNPEIYNGFRGFLFATAYILRISSFCSVLLGLHTKVCAPSQYSHALTYSYLIRFYFTMSYILRDTSKTLFFTKYLIKILGCDILFAQHSLINHGTGILLGKSVCPLFLYCGTVLQLWVMRFSMRCLW